MSQGHLIPMIDIARLLAKQNVIVTIITTPQNAARFSAGINRDIESGLLISVQELHFPAAEVGLPEGCETVDNLPSFNLFSNFHAAMRMLQKPVEELLRGLNPIPNCIIHDKHFTWMAEVASKFQIPRVLFDGKGCFTLLWGHNIITSKVHECVSEGEPFVVPGLSDRIEFTTRQLPGHLNPGSNMKEISEKVMAAEQGAYGLIVNSFEELEQEYVESYQKIKTQKVYCVGPVSLCNKNMLDKATRGNKGLTNEKKCLKFLDSWPESSVLYISFGSLSHLTPHQLTEIGLALESSNRPFIWVIRGGNKKEEMEKWLEEYGIEERVKGRGLLIRDWAPQVLILSHPSVGGFLTHCGWNSTLEGICGGVPMITWPMFAEQFFNEKLLVQILKVGVRVGVEVVVQMGEEEKSGVLVKSENVKNAIENSMDEGEEGEERRKRARNLAEMANKAVKEGGSSYLNITLLIEDIKQQATISNLH
ncbi:UDP-glucuronosyl/UDP-glucosyltransferase [Corchorus capsularis]|uniref:Glycosyltransferase n=1 Tax=Corchorus capsularis TaxID=210143 RepID=A0A1R3IH08_COCAP|nr:UDP-glucuronosyl/UDP-glucosyltransferase [Corchorus capsularis]